MASEQTLNPGQGSQSTRCLVCIEPSKTESLCELHHLAKEKLNHSYKIWQKAYTRISYHDYLQFLTRLPETGDAILGIAKLILESEDGDSGNNTHHM